VTRVAVSLNGCMTGFEANLSRFYSLLPSWREDITPTGADTILAQEPELAAAIRPGPPEARRCSSWSNAAGRLVNGRH
jgi:2,5-diamino-6-(ribosylamino)-4(3H)-pyrimidinone 5'-phosphate reductase